ncbi:helix-turn-helix domain-containing protein [Clostridium sp. MCC353]|nr:helix-turn-helix domain-containing protein [Clostridium sp. MCC353]
MLKESTGLSFSKYLQSVRMENAKKLLEGNNLTVAVVAQLTGYSSESHFVQCYKKYYGYTPGKTEKRNH